jgi:hypothetical protein
MAVFLEVGGSVGAYDQGELFSGAYRLLLVFAPDAEHEDLRRMERETQAKAQKLDDRDMRVVRVIGAEDRTLRERYRVPVEEFRLLLIGKDGGSGRREMRERGR